MVVVNIVLAVMKIMEIKTVMQERGLLSDYLLISFTKPKTNFLI